MSKEAEKSKKPHLYATIRVLEGLDPACGSLQQHWDGVTELFHETTEGTSGGTFTAVVTIHIENRIGKSCACTFETNSQRPGKNSNEICATNIPAACTRTWPLSCQNVARAISQMPIMWRRQSQTKTVPHDAVHVITVALQRNHSNEGNSHDSF